MTSSSVASDVPRRGGRVRSVLSVVAVALFFTNADSYAFAMHLGPPPVQWVELMAAAAAVLVIVDPQRPLGLLRSPLFAWIGFYFFLTTAWGIWATPAPDVVQVLYDRYRSIATIVTFAIVFGEVRARRLAVGAVAFAVVAAAILNVAETLSLVSFAEIAGWPRVPGRSAGFYINPNGAGMAIALGIAAVIEVVPRTWRVPLILVGVLGVSATFSRGAMIVLAFVLLWTAWRRSLGYAGLAVAASCLVIVLAYAAQYMGSHDLLTENTSARVRLEKDDSGRIEVAVMAWHQFLNSPLLGNGLGSTIEWNMPRPHNMFAMLASDHGVLGLLAFPALGLAVVRSNRGAACFALALMVAGFFSHDILEDRYTLLLTALAAANGFGSVRDRAGDGCEVAAEVA